MPDLACLGIGLALLALGGWAVLSTVLWRRCDRGLAELRRDVDRLGRHDHPHHHPHAHTPDGRIVAGDPATARLRAAVRGDRRPRPYPPGDPGRR